MTTPKERLVKDAFDACKNGDTGALRRIFGYEQTVEIKGVFCSSEDLYPGSGQAADFDYRDVEEQGDGRVRSRLELELDGEKYEADILNTVSGGRIVSSYLTWHDKPHEDGTDGDAAWYSDKYGWWGWPFGRRW